MNDEWIVIDTPMRPRRFKVARRGKEFSDNAVCNYFVTESEAHTEANKRNKNDIRDIIFKDIHSAFEYGASVSEVAHSLVNNHRIHALAARDYINDYLEVNPQNKFFNERDFIAMAGRDPIHDDLERLNCKDAGKAGHHQCGFCNEHYKPRFLCGCLKMTP